MKALLTSPKPGRGSRNSRQGYLHFILDSSFSSHSLSSHLSFCSFFLFEYSKMSTTFCGSGGVSSPHHLFWRYRSLVPPQRTRHFLQGVPRSKPSPRPSNLTGGQPSRSKLGPLLLSTPAGGSTAHPGTGPIPRSGPHSVLLQMPPSAMDLTPNSPHNHVLLSTPTATVLLKFSSSLASNSTTATPTGPPLIFAPCRSQDDLSLKIKKFF